jgi:hypothetical protein
MDLDMAIKTGKLNKQEYNELAFANYNEKALVPCEKCGRTFLPDSLKRHLKGCKGEKPLKKGGKHKSYQRFKSQDRKSEPAEEEEVEETSHCKNCDKDFSGPLGAHLKKCN